MYCLFLLFIDYGIYWKYSVSVSYCWIKKLQQIQVTYNYSYLFAHGSEIGHLGWVKQFHQKSMLKLYYNSLRSFQKIKI